MISPRYPSSRVHSERTITVARLVLTGTSALAVLLDPSEVSQYVWVTWTFHLAYVVYAAALVAVSFAGEMDERVALVSHFIDIVAFSILQYFTLIPSSPFFIFFVFSMFCAAVRWGWRGTLFTGATVMVVYLGIVGSLSTRLAPPMFDLNRFIIRLAYLLVATWMLVYLGRYEERLRTEIERLARWPAPLVPGGDEAIGRVLEYAAGLMHAGRALVFWEAGDEPALHEAQWAAGDVTVQRHPPDTLTLLTDEHLARSTFICSGSIRDAQAILVLDQSGRLIRQPGVPMSPALLDRLGTNGLASAPLKTDAVSGRVFFSDLGTPPTEALALTEAVAREIASSLDQLHAAEQRQEMATREQQIRVARDLHDGVLQALTGVRLELRALASSRPDSPESLRHQLGSLERAIAMEQRELRFFISGLEPGADRQIHRRSALAMRLDSVRERLALEWKTPVTLRVSPHLAALPEPIEDAIPLMVHEAAVNALKHAQASRVSVDVEATDGHVRVAVTDDGHGFPFYGHFSHASLAESHAAPRSLFDRVSALGGQLSIDSSEQGSRVEMVLSL